jgi:hypothetical protein
MIYESEVFKAGCGFLRISRRKAIVVRYTNVRYQALV